MLTEDRLAKQVRAVEHGRSDGRDNAPAFRASNLSATENDAISLAQNAINDLAEAFRKRILATANQPIVKEPFNNQVFDDINVEAKNYLSTHRDNDKDKLSGLRTDERRSFREYIYFQRDNNLNRQAYYPRSQFLNFSLIFFILACDTFVNAWFFADASDRGLLGGIITAGLFSMFNVLVAIGIGVFPYRYLQHARRIHLLWSIAFFAVGVGVVVAFNLAIGHYREMLMINPDAPVQAVMPRMMAGPVTINEVKSWMLVGIGLLIAAVGLYKGFTLDDPYPGYGRVDRRHRRALALYNESKNRIRAELTKSLAGHVGRCDGVMSKLQKRAADLEAALAELRKERTQLEAQFKSIASVCNNVVRLYRDENRSVRTDPEPAYFSSAVTLRVPEHWPELKEIEAAFAELARQIATLMERGMQVKREVGRIYEVEIQQIAGLIQDAEQAADQTLKQEAEIRAAAG